jgi:hypothetical protein
MITLSAKVNKLAVASVFAISILGCRTTLKPITNTVDTVNVDMQIVGLRPADQARSELVYTLTACGLGSANGVKNESNVVAFQAQGVKKDDVCDVRVEAGKTDVGVANWNSEPGLMYIAQKVKISSSEGKLSGLAFVQQKYISPPTIPNSETPAPAAMVWKLRVTVASPTPIANCTCTIQCSPALMNNVAMLEPGEAVGKGSCEFANLVSPDSKNTSCRNIGVQCGSDFYLGSWASGAPTDGSIAGAVSLPDVSLIKGTPDATSDATIEVVIPQ